MISPEVIVSRPAIIRSAVVLPHPEGPTSTANSRSRISIERLSTAVTEPNRFTRFFRITLAMSLTLFFTSKNVRYINQTAPHYKSQMDEKMFVVGEYD
jgi:hypothetical protein